MNAEYMKTGIQEPNETSTYATNKKKYCDDDGDGDGSWIGNNNSNKKPNKIV